MVRMKAVRSPPERAVTDILHSQNRDVPAREGRRHAVPRPARPAGTRRPASRGRPISIDFSHPVC